MPGPALVELLREQSVTTVTFPPSALSALPDDDLPALDTVVVAGEACPAELPARWAAGRTLVNAYGPSETTVCATFAVCRDVREPPPIGRPLDNARVYLLDRYLRPTPVGVRGELYVGGVGVGRGYLRQPAQTAASFIPDPYSREPGGRLYRTGDLGQCREDGNIEFHGRTDHQVKVRGYRIEPGEVEAALEAHSGVSKAAVIVREGPSGDKQLIAYTVLREPQIVPAVHELRIFLGECLPDYMIPSVFVALEALPLTPVGKLDHQALREAEARRLRLDAEYAAPDTDLERTVAAVWETVLGVERVGMDDNFFDLGAHSLLMVRAHARLREIYGKDLPLVALFRYPTVRHLARHLGEQHPHPSAQLDETKLVKLREGMNRLHRMRQSQQLQG
jgi:acyl-coenzyme A synthetase/AMP-(fatty) acid ligase/acyl carrier protein